MGPLFCFKYSWSWCRSSSSFIFMRLFFTLVHSCTIHRSYSTTRPQQTNIFQKGPNKHPYCSFPPDENLSKLIQLVKVLEPWLTCREQWQIYILINKKENNSTTLSSPKKSNKEIMIAVCISLRSMFVYTYNPLHKNLWMHCLYKFVGNAPRAFEYIHI